jgi:hypothetical protein
MASPIGQLLIVGGHSDGFKKIIIDITAAAKSGLVYIRLENVDDE